MEEASRKRKGFPDQRLDYVPLAVTDRCQNLPVVQDLYVTSIGHFPLTQHHYVDRSDGCADVIFIYCTNGAGWCDLEGHHYELKEGEALFIPPQRPHVYGADESTPWSIYWVHFTGQRVAVYLEALAVSATEPRLYVPDALPIVEAFEEVYEHVRHGHANIELLAQSTALAHLLGVVKCHQRSSHLRGRHQEERIFRSIRYMREHIDEPCSLKEFAESAHFSVSHYSHLFKQQINTSPVKFFIRLKMQKSCRLLDKTDLSVEKIADRVGYQDPYHFSRMFKKVIGKSPTEFRNRPRG